MKSTSPPTSGRHTFATTLVRGGTDLVTVADMLGHGRLDTVRLYTHSTVAGP
jgi:site-specific recombinase XerD